MSILLAIIVLLVCLGGIFLSIYIYKILIRIQSNQEVEDAKKSHMENDDNSLKTNTDKV